MLGEHIKILSGYAFKSKEFNEDGHGIPIVRIRDVGKKKSNTFYSGEFSEEYLLDNGDFLIGMDGDFRLAKWQGGKALLNQRVCKIMPKESSLIKEYMYYMVPRELKKIEDTTSFATVKHLSVKKIKDIKIPLPPLDQQKKIAAILDAADAYRQKTKALIEKYDELTQSLFLDMFGDPVTNPKGWGELEFKDIVIKEKNAIVDGPFGSSIKQIDYVDEGIPIIRINNVRNEGYYDAEYKYLRREKYLELIRSKVQQNDILIARVGNTIGKACVFNKSFEALLSTTGVAKASIDLSRYNLFFIIKMISLPIYKQYIMSFVQGAGQPYLNLSKIKLFKVIDVPFNLQNQFAERVQAIEAQKAQAEASLAGAEDLFNSLLQKAFKGELTS